MAYNRTFTKDVDFELDSIQDIITTHGKTEFDRKGYNFKNWYDENGEVYTDSMTVRFTSEEVNLSADWEKKTYDLDYTQTLEGGTVEVRNTSGAVIAPGEDALQYEGEFKVVATADEGYAKGTISVTGATLKEGTEDQFIVDDSSATVTVTVTFTDIQGTLTYYPGY